MHSKRTRRWLSTTVLALSAIVLLSCGQAPSTADNTQATSSPEKKVFNSPLAGSWYTADPAQLRSEIEGYLANAKTKPVDDIIALVLPHAGYRYSGQTAAYGVKLLEGRTYDRVLIIGPTHRVGMPNRLSVPDVSHYATPLGEIPLDVDFIDRLQQHDMVGTIPAAHIGEHSVQIEMPLLQVALGAFKAVPIVVGQLDRDGTRRAAELLRSMIDEHTLVVVSTDFTHYGPNYNYIPFKEDVPEQLKELDMGAFEAIEQGDMDRFYSYLEETGATVCGRCPVALLLAMLPDDAAVTLLRYDTSGALTGNFKNSVSYIAAAVSGSWPAATAQADKPDMLKESRDDPFTDAEQKTLLDLARGTLTYYLEHRRRPSPEDLGIELTPAMKEVMGAFVTLHRSGRLRGCIGEIFPRRELYKAVMDHAINAGVNDRRFSRVQAHELPELDFEISALSPPRAVDSYKDIVIGKHGIVVRKRGRQAVYLPQVAPEQGWNVEETLTHLSQKAGLPGDAWKSDCDFLVFEATVFGEGHE